MANRRCVQRDQQHSASISDNVDMENVRRSAVSSACAVLVKRDSVGLHV